MRITYDPWKHQKTLDERQLDFKRAPEIFAGLQFSFLDKRKDYGEDRYTTIGLLNGRMVVMVWTPRGAARHIISLRKANGKEQKNYKNSLG